MKQRESAAEKQKNADESGKHLILETLKAEADWCTVRTIRDATGMGNDRTNKLLRELLDAGRIESKKSQHPNYSKRETRVYRIKNSNAK